jgi:hypothetical protein
MAIFSGGSTGLVADEETSLAADALAPIVDESRASLGYRRYPRVSSYSAFEDHGVDDDAG